MAKFAHSDVLDQGPALIKSACVRMLLISAYAAGDSYATVQAAKLTEVVMTSADFTLASAGTARTLTVAAGKTATLSAPATGTDLHIAFTDGASRVLWVTDETTNGSASAGAVATFPGPVYTSSQPT